jgi:AGZA family xanthine/uracil permease-like MFS transporter
LRGFILNSGFKYNWLSVGDIGASATIIFDNLTLLTFISIILHFGYQFPEDIILTRIIPGTVFGVLVGNLLCIWLGFRLAKKEQRHVTAIPLGVDAPSAIGFIVCIVGPAFNSFKSQTGMSVHDAGLMAWHVGVGSLFVLGLIKLFCSLFAQKIKDFVPQAALLGGVGGVAIALIGFFPLISIIKMPIIGLISFILVMLTTIIKVRLPFNIPGIPSAIVVSTIVFYVLIPTGLSGTMPDLSTNLGFILPMPSFGFLGVMPSVIKVIPLIVPFALLVVFGTMSVAESASCVGETYNVRSLVIVDAIATLAGSLCGGVSQTTPYAGFPAYKKMDSRAGFLMINILVVGIGGIFGLVGFIVHLVPEAAVAPILLYVAFEIMMQGFIQCEKKYYAPILFAFLPSIARLLQIKFTDGSLIDVAKLQADMFNVSHGFSDQLIIIAMGNGFIVTGILWAAFLCFAINRQVVKSFICCVVLAVLSYFGMIHSVYTTGQIYLPSSLPEGINKLPLEFALGYLAMGFIILATRSLKQGDLNSH